MRIDVHLTTEPIPRPFPLARETGPTGAEAEFYGIVRAQEGDTTISGLRYDIYPRMAESEIRRILGELGREYPCQAVAVSHRHGFIPVGDAAVYVGVQARHRHEAFALLTAFMDRLKQDVPIWKVEAVPC